MASESPEPIERWTAKRRVALVVKEADAGRPVNEIWRHYGISSATYYKWKAIRGAGRNLKSPV